MHLFGPLLFHKLHLRIGCAPHLFLTLTSHLPRMDPNASHSQPSSSPSLRNKHRTTANDDMRENTPQNRHLAIVKDRTVNHTQESAK